MNYRAVSENPNVIYEKMVEASKRGDHPLTELNILRIQAPEEIEEGGRFLVNKNEFWRLEYLKLMYGHEECMIHVYDITRTHGHAPLEICDGFPNSLTETLKIIESLVGARLEEITVEVQTVFKPKKNDHVTQI